MPRPRALDGEWREGLEAGDVGTESKIAISHLERCRGRAGVAVRIEGPDDVAPLGWADGSYANNPK